MSQKGFFSKKLSTSINLRHFQVLTGIRGVFASPKVPHVESSTAGELSASTEAAQSPLDQVNGDPHFQSDQTPLIENDDPFRKRIHLWRPTFLQTRLAPFKRIGRWFKTYYTPRQLSEQELEQKRLNAERKRLDSLLSAQASDAKLLIINALTRLNFCWRPEKGPTQEVVFDIVYYSEMAIYLHVDTARLPRGVRILELATEMVCTDLSASVRHPVRANIERVEESVTGLTFVVELAATFGIPDRVNYASLLKQVPPGYPALSFPVGLAENKRPMFRSLESMPHCIVCGQTLGGKSNMLNAITCSILARNTPADVQLFMVDLKGGGIEFSTYIGVPHLGSIPKVPSGIGRNVGEGIEILEHVCKVSAERQQMFTNQIDSGKMIKNLDEWNRSHKIRRLPKIVVIVDELALLLDPDDKASRNRALRLIREISATARAAGVYLLVATQSSDKYIFNNSVKTNFPGRIAFSFPDYSGSLLAINDGSAINLMPAGRAIYKNGTDKFLVQTPLITNADITAIVNNAKAGKTTAEIIESGLTDQEIVEWAITENNGLISKRAILEKFAGRIEAKGVLLLMQSTYDQTFSVGEYDYTVKRGRGNQPSLVVRLDENSPNPDPSAPISGTEPQTTNPVHEFRDALRATLDAFEVEYVAGDFNGDGICLALDTLLLNPPKKLRHRETVFLADLKALCQRFNAEPLAGGFSLNGQRLDL